MINLLPPDIKQNISYGRRNARLGRWIAGLLVGILGIVVVSGVGYIYLNRLGRDYNTQAVLAQAELNKQDPVGTQKQVEDISNSLKLVVEVLSREVLFSKLLKQVGASLPSGSVLTGISINKIQGGIDLQASATDYQTASQIQVNLQDPNNKIFDKADIISITCSKTSDSIYPCVAVLRAQFAANNPYLFINSAGTP